MCGMHFENNNKYLTLFLIASCLSQSTFVDFCQILKLRGIVLKWMLVDILFMFTDNMDVKPQRHMQESHLLISDISDIFAELSET